MNECSNCGARYPLALDAEICCTGIDLDELADDECVDLIRARMTVAAGYLRRHERLEARDAGLAPPPVRRSPHEEPATGSRLEETERRPGT